MARSKKKKKKQKQNKNMYYTFVSDGTLADKTQLLPEPGLVGHFFLCKRFLGRGVVGGMYNKNTTKIPPKREKT